MPTFYNDSTFWSVFSQLFSSFCINYQENCIFFFGCKFLYTALFKKYRYIHLSTCCNADEPYSFMIILYSANKNNVMAFHQISQKQQSDRQWLSESNVSHFKMTCVIFEQYWYTRLMMCDYRERGQLSVTSGITLIQINTETFPAFIAAPRADKLDS